MMILVRPTVGPMARNVDTLVQAMQHVLCAKLFTRDTTIPPLPFNIEVGVFHHTFIVRCISF